VGALVGVRVLLEPDALAGHLEDHRVVDEAVDCCGSGHRVLEDERHLKDSDLPRDKTLATLTRSRGRHATIGDDVVRPALVPLLRGTGQGSAPTSPRAGRDRCSVTAPTAAGSVDLIMRGCTGGQGPNLPKSMRISSI